MKRKMMMMALAAMLLGLQGVKAQYTFPDGNKVRKFGVFDHMAVGLNAGTAGIGLEVAAPITDFLALRAGYSVMPKLKYKTDVDYKQSGQTKQTEVEARLNMADFDLLLDIYPVPSSGFHLTAGFFMGKEELIDVVNTTPVLGVDGGLEIGDYIVGFDKNGFARASIDVAAFKPYVGLGFGRAVPRKRLTFSMELGTQLWGTPKVYEHQTGTKQQLTKQDTGTEAGEVIKVISKITFYPMLNFRLSGRIF